MCVSINRRGSGVCRYQVSSHHDPGTPRLTLDGYFCYVLCDVYLSVLYTADNDAVQYRTVPVDSLSAFALPPATARVRLSWQMTCGVRCLEPGSHHEQQQQQQQQQQQHTQPGFDFRSQETRSAGLHEDMTPLRTYYQPLMSTRYQVRHIIASVRPRVSY